MRPRKARATAFSPAASPIAVGVCLGLFDRHRKLFVCFATLECGFVALNHTAAAIIAFRVMQPSVDTFWKDPD
jgi:hypothetical protein